jgi:hypothetical protein
MKEYRSRRENWWEREGRGGEIRFIQIRSREHQNLKQKIQRGLKCNPSKAEESRGELRKQMDGVDDGIEACLSRAYFPILV